MINYTVGFLFSDNLENLILIHRKKADWQQGLLNGIGGKIEANEDPYDAMKREFEEEAGLYIDGWDEFATIRHNDDWKIHVFRNTAPLGLIEACETRCPEEGTIINCFIKYGVPDGTIENLKWLIPLALSNDSGIPLDINERRKR